MNHLSKDQGVLTIAHTHARFARQAVALARSIRLRDPHLPLAVMTDLDADLFKGMFDQVIPWNFADRPGFTYKFEVYEASPFQTTLYIDSDCLALGSLTSVFTFFEGQDFGVFGSNLSDGLYRFLSMEAVRARVPSAAYPDFNSGLFYYRKSAMAAQVFECARALVVDYDVLHLRRLNGQIADEALFSVAMAKLGLAASEASEEESIVPIGVPKRAYFDNDVDTLNGRGSVTWKGRTVQSVLMHFSGIKSRRFPYIREDMRLAEAFQNSERKVRSEVSVSMRALFTWLLPPIRRRIRRVARRLFSHS